MASHSVPSALSLAVTEAEAGILALYDQLQQLQLELALLQSQQAHHASGQSSHVLKRVVRNLALTSSPEDGGSRVPGHDLAATQTRLLEAKATLALRNSVVESVTAVQPTLNAVHHMPRASVVERYRLT